MRAVGVILAAALVYVILAGCAPHLVDAWGWGYALVVTVGWCVLVVRGLA